MYDVISTAPLNTDELINIVNFITDTRNNVLPDVIEQTVEVLLSELFLADFVQFTGKKLQQYTELFQSVERVKSIILNSTKMINEKTQEFIKTLLERTAAFEVELNVYNSEVNELVNFEDINDIDKYAEKTRYLDDKLTEALDIIDELNREEKYFKLKETVFPLRKIVNLIINSKYLFTIYTFSSRVFV